MDPRRVAVALASFATAAVAALAATCLLVYVLAINPSDRVGVSIESPPDGASTFLLGDDGSRIRHMDEYSGMVFQTPEDPLRFFREYDREGPLPGVGRRVVVPAQWIDARRYGVLAYLGSRTWKLWWVAEANLRRPTWSDWPGEELRASIILTEKDAVPVSHAEALRLLGLAGQPRQAVTVNP